MASARTYLGFLFGQRGRDDPVGDLARDAFYDSSWDGSQHALKLMTRDTAAEDAFERSVREYRKWMDSFKTGKRTSLKGCSDQQKDT